MSDFTAVSSYLFAWCELVRGAAPAAVKGCPHPSANRLQAGDPPPLRPLPPQVSPTGRRSLPLEHIAAFPKIRFYDFAFICCCQVRLAPILITKQKQVDPAHPRAELMRNQAPRVRPPAFQWNPASAVCPRWLSPLPCAALRAALPRQLSGNTIMRLCDFPEMCPAGDSCCAQR